MLLRSHAFRAVVSCLVGTGVLLVSGMALAQLPYIPPEVYQEHRRLQGNQISFCIWEPNVTVELDRDVATAVADALLLEPQFYTYSPPSEMEEPAFWNNVLVLLTEHCSVIVGFNLVSDAYPDWLVTSRAYYQAPFTFVVANDSYERLGDIPRDEILGSMLHSEADHQFSSYLSTLADDERWRRFPYDDPEHLLRHIENDVVEGGLLWEPQLIAATNGEPTAEGFRSISLDPMPSMTRRVGFVVRQDDTYIRTMLDGAIRALIEDGSIEGLIADHALPGSAPSLE